MLKIRLVFATILAVLGTSQAFIPPAGKCKDISFLKLVNDDQLEMRQWYSVYYPDGEEFKNVDSDYEDISLTPDNKVHGVHQIRMKDNTVSPYAYKYSFGSDSVIREDVIDDNGQKQEFLLYILQAVPGENAFLYYRCSETGSLGYDTRFISVRRGSSLSAAAEQQLLAKDASYSFTGGIRKLDNKLV